MSEEQLIWVRIKPRNEKKGLRLRRLSAYGHRFDEEKGWYMITRFLQWDGRRVDVAEYLASFRNNPDDEDSPLAFDVCTEEEAKAIERAERQRAEIRAHASRPFDLTTSDLRRGSSEVEPELRATSTPNTNIANDNAAALEQPMKRKPGRPRKNIAL